ncbi:MAG: ABC transporter permease [Candidatus Sumerlaeaceae bacterium]
MNALKQIVSITNFGLLSIPQRRGSVAAAVVGIAGVVAVLVGVLSIATGIRRVMDLSGSPDSAIVLRTGADSEMMSGLGRDETRVILDAPGLARDTDGPLASAELFVIIDIPKLSTGTEANVPLRGVQPAAPKVREHFKIVQGRMFEWGKNEIIVGIGALREFAGLDLGKSIRVGRNTWTVVGVFSANGGSTESEIWTDAKVLQDGYNRGESYQSMSVKLASASAFQQFKDALTANPQLRVKVQRQSEYYANQSRMLSSLITTLGYLIAGLMAMGAVFGALNTMYSSVSARTREIATLRALGFGRAPIVVAFMLESICLALIGGVLGAAVSYLVFNGFETATMANFSQVTFAFAVTTPLLVQGILWATVIGLFGGFLPALRAARLPIATALREM